MVEMGIKIRVKNVHKSFGNLKVLNGISFDVYDGEFLCILGPSGCGKTTLLRIIGGLESANEGYVEIDGKEPSPKNHKIGYVPQDEALFPWRTIHGNIGIGLEIMKIRKQEVEKRVRELIEFIGLSGFELYYPHQLSGGMRKKVAIARALAIDPDILLFDEPFADLDIQTRYILLGELIDIWSKLKKTVVFVTHSIDEAIFLADRIIILSKIPAKVKETVKVELKRPRDLLSDDFLRIKREISKYMGTPL